MALAKGIARVADGHLVYILLNGLFTDTIDELRRAFEGTLGVDRFLVFSVSGPVNEITPENKWRRRTAELLREFIIDSLSPDVVLTTSMVEGAEDDTVVAYGNLYSIVPRVAVIYDLIPLSDPERYIGWEPARIWYYGKIDSLLRADLLLAISDATRKEAIRLLNIPPTSIVNISSAADDSFSAENISASHSKAVADRFGIVKKYLMHSSAFEARKNFHGLIRAFAALPRNIRTQYQLVLVSKLTPANRAELLNAAEKAGLRPNELVLTGFVPDSDLVALYVGCHLFVFPSFQEGFGLPALEAMSCGTATIGSNATSIPEVIGRQDALFDPASDESMAALILKALTDERFYRSLKKHALNQSALFNWNETARRAIAAMEVVVAAIKAKQKPLLDPINRRKSLFEAVAKIARECAPSEQEVLDLAGCLEANENAVKRVQAATPFCDQMAWRIEGPFDSTYSLALLNRETARALTGLGHIAVLHSTEGPGDFAANPVFLELNSDIKAMHAAVVNFPHEKADVVTRNLYPPRVTGMEGGLNTLHHYAWEESGFPAAWVADFNSHLDGMTCLSNHVEKVMLDNGVHLPMATSGAGVDHWERIAASITYRVDGRQFRFLHVSSCFPRKGIDILLEAFGVTFTDADDVSLIVKTFPNPHNNIHALLAEHRSRASNYPHVVVIDGDLSEADLKSLYKQCHALVAPSRAEGFGLPLAEAMLSGLSVITTAWSGQLDFCTDETAWLVDFDFEVAKTHFGLTESVWAAPQINSLSDKLSAVWRCSSDHREAKTLAGRRLLLESFTWRDVAARLVTSVRTWQSRSINNAGPRLGWVTTWNTKCGIASYSRQLVARFPQRTTIFAAHSKDHLQEDGPECVRCWSSSKEKNDFDELENRLAEFDIEVLVVQFNYGFYNFRQFSNFITHQVEAGRGVIVMMHATGDPALEPRWNWSLAEIVPSLRRCHRVLVHTVGDLNRLKRIGLMDNVALFPQGIDDSIISEVRAVSSPIPLVAAYGFCLPHKGLKELVSAVSILKSQATPVRLRLVNAEYPDAVSRELLKAIRQFVEDNELKELVEIHSEYLADEESLRLLVDADLIVYPYQETNESSSAAVRMGLATGKPVAVTPIPIFSELESAVHHFPGTRPTDLARGIHEILRDVKNRTDGAESIARSAEQWRSSHASTALSRRLHGICKGVALTVSRFHRVFDGSSRQMQTSGGTINGRALESRQMEGHLLWGLYLTISVGRYVVIIRGSYDVAPGASAKCDICVRGGEVLAEKAFIGTKDDIIARIPFFVPQRFNDLEVRVIVDKLSLVRIESVEIMAAPEMMN